MADHVRRLVGVVVLIGLLGVPAAVAPPPASASRHVARVAVVDSTYAVDDVALPAGRRVTRAEGVEPFTTLGVSYDSASGAEGRVRAHLAGGWTQWFDLHQHHGGPEPIWVGDDADGYEVRLPADAADAVLHLVRATGVAARVAPAAESAEVFNPAPPIRRREAWGAAPFRGTPVLNGRITQGVFHHTVNSNTYSQAQVPSMLRSIQAFHQGTRRWPDIAYNFIVDRFGVIWEGRDRSYEDPVRVSATSGTEVNTVTVAYLGDGSSYTPSGATLRAMGRLLGWKMRKHGLLPTRANVSGHTQIGQTSCPGAAIMAKARAIENAAMAGNPPPGPYWDVPWTSRNAEAIDWVGDRRIIPGFPDHTYRPTNPSRRADTVVWLWRMAGEPSGSSHPYTDVPPDAPYREALEWASDNDIAKGVSPTRFAPRRTMTRQGMIDMLWRWQSSPEIPVAHGFGDAGPRPSLDWAREAGVVGGSTFRPGDPTTRANAAAFLFDLRPFTDVPRSSPYRNATDWAKAHVIVTGFGNHTFRPGDDASRAAGAEWIWRFMDRPAPGPVDPTPGGDGLDRATAVTWLWQAAGSPTVALPSGYGDVASGEPHEMAAAWSEDFDLFPEIGSTFDADRVVTRGELVRGLYRLADRPAAWAVTPPSTVRF